MYVCELALNKQMIELFVLKDSDFWYAHFSQRPSNVIIKLKDI